MDAAVGGSLSFRKTSRLAPLLGVILALTGCASHPTVSPRTLAPGEKTQGITFSAENIFPVYFYRYGLTPMTDVGFRLGIPVYGTGLDISRTLANQEGKRDVINLAWSLGPNANYDFTYYKLSSSKRRKGSTSYWALRAMYIPEGIAGHESLRFGFLLGAYLRRIGYEVGYFHDPSAMPLSKIFSTDFQQEGEFKRYAEFPLISDFGLPTEHSRPVGITIRISYLFAEKPSSPPTEPQ